MKHLIYAVEDDASIRGLYELTFERFGFDIKTFETAEEFLECILKGTAPSLILLDLMLPKMDGLSVIKVLRRESRFNRIPIIIISAKGDEKMKIAGLEAGADDFVAKPFKIGEIVARVKSNIRQSVPDEAHTFTAKDMELSEAAQAVTVAGKPLPLTAKEYALLRLLLKRDGELVTKQELLLEVCGHEFDANTRTLDMHVMAIRNKIAPVSDKEYIQTVRGLGYKILKD